MLKYTATIKSGEGTDPDVTLGPIQNFMQYERVKGFFEDIEKDNLKVVAGGKNDLSSPGYFITPTIIDRPKDESRIMIEEPFGPILPIVSWSDEDEVIARANDTRMGLGASVWSSDLDEAKRIANRIEAGNVWVNTHMEVDARYPFSGHKESGIGCEWSTAGMKSYCNVQMLMIKKV